MGETQASATLQVSQHNYAPGAVVTVRDEMWLITNVARSVDGYRLKVRGLSEYVRDEDATFYSALDHIEVLDPTKVEVVPDHSPGYRQSRLWLETTLRQTPIPLYQEQLSVSTQMLLDPLDYQLCAVRKALSTKNPRPRVLIADAVGLGKTLEIGMILSELIRRGRGERILVVTPRHIMEQFQQELWARFAIPLVRLDSVGIQKVRQILPASRNPFTYYPRVIISLDTIKSPKYRAQLEKVRWDAVVIDEIHNSTNTGTLNNALARTVASTAEALLLASATPHNGDPESFKEILRLLDPTAVLPDGTIDRAAAERLIIRRHRNSPEVADEVGRKWAKRAEPRNVHVPASPEEDAIAAELDEVWINPRGKNPAGDRLFPWTMVKAFLSSPAALSETVRGRIKRVEDSDPEQADTLRRLERLSNSVTPASSAKFQQLLEELTRIGISKKSQTRVVIFSERVATLHWLKKNLSTALGMPAGAVEVMHGGLPDQEQMRLVDEFKRTDSKLRILVTGDVASEGVNLHTLCHHLIHYDIPWSLIRIQQRNGRIDRYGQLNSPEITSLLLDPSANNNVGELHVLLRLLEREDRAHTIIGDAGALMGKHSVKLEEDAIRDVLQGQRDFDDVVADPEMIADSDSMDSIDALLASLESGGSNEPGSVVEAVAASESAASLYEQEIDYLQDALREAFHGTPEAAPGRNGVGFVKHPNSTAELLPPKDLQRRLDFLPQDYVADRRVKEKFVFTTSFEQGQQVLTAARTGEDGSTWPRAHHLGPLHPVTDWATDLALANLSRGQIPAVQGSVSEPTVFLMATLSNKRGQVISRSFIATSDIFNTTVVTDPVEWLRSVGLGADAVNRGDTRLPDDHHSLIEEAVRLATDQATPMSAEARKRAEERIESWSDRAHLWEAGIEIVGQRTAPIRHSEKLIQEERQLMNALMPDQQLIRPLVLVLPNEQEAL
ncbi:DEAD/DEAH box helicase [Flaviflexus huanghaiensis]|uniref:DEAD/DEAH box helicase n=1 Tax=Flaviflexus huanghaiensis TaxID=1111473 RepID=UPI0015FDE8A7|nr:DEAD/DEAH box helicase [Flaviflexus huanghaiensis]